MLAMHGLHLLLCWPLMGGVGPLPPLGLQGFAIAMLLSRAFGVAFHLYLWRLRLELVPKRRDWWAMRWDRLAPVLHIGLPGAAENVAYRLALMFTIALVARMGATELATHTYTMQLMYFILLSGLAIGFASEILVGHMVGAAALHEANQLVRKSLGWGLVVSTSLALLAALTARWTMPLFTSDPRVIDTAQTLLWITVLLEPGRTFNLVVINALRATGDLLPPPKWQQHTKPERVSAQRLLQNLRFQVWGRGLALSSFSGFSPPPPSAQNSEKLLHSLPSAIFYAQA